MARRPRISRKVVVALAAVVALVVGVGTGWVVYLNQQLDDVGRIGVDFGPTRDGADSPASGEPGDLTVLVAGVDAGDGPEIAEDLSDGSWTAGRFRTDTIMVVHLAADRLAAQVVSVPRDTWVSVPGLGDAKINAAFSVGGPSLMVQTVEQFTGVELDHLVVLDWNAFKQITSAVGGVEVSIPEDVYDTQQDVEWQAGTYRLEGEQALQYVRQRHGLPRGDFDRIDRQQNFMRATLAEVMSSGTVLNPLRLTQVIQALGDHLLVDDGLSNDDLRSLALSLRGLRQDGVDFLTVPVTGLDTVDGQSIVRVDQGATRRLLRAVVDGELEGYLRANGGDVLGGSDTVR